METKKEDLESVLNEQLASVEKEADLSNQEEVINERKPINYTDNVIVKESENKRWYILRAFVGQEQRAVNELVRKLEMYELLDKLVEIFTPKEQMVVLDGGVTKHKQESFYPGYVFVAFDIKHENEVHDVANLFMKVHNQMCQVSLEEVKRMKELTENSASAPTTSMNIKEDQAVRVISGSYVDMTGKVANIDVANKKVTVKLSIFDREVEVKLGIDEIKAER